MRALLCESLIALDLTGCVLLPGCVLSPGPPEDSCLGSWWSPVLALLSPWAGAFPLGGGLRGRGRRAPQLRPDGRRALARMGDAQPGKVLL